MNFAKAIFLIKQQKFLIHRCAEPAVTAEESLQLA